MDKDTAENIQAIAIFLAICLAASVLGIAIKWAAGPPDPPTAQERAAQEAQEFKHNSFSGI